MDLHQIHIEDVFGPSLRWVSKSGLSQGHQAQKRHFSALWAACVPFVFGKTILASSYYSVYCVDAGNWNCRVDVKGAMPLPSQVWKERWDQLLVGSLLWHCWLGDRKDIQPQTPALQVPEAGHCLTWSSSVANEENENKGSSSSSHTSQMFCL